jgi:uncharacterized membrane protein YvbJ
MHTCSKCGTSFDDVTCKACGNKPMKCSDGQCSCGCGKTQPEDDLWCDNCLSESK